MAKRPIKDLPSRPRALAAARKTTRARASNSRSHLGQKKPSCAQRDLVRRTEINGRAWISTEQNPQRSWPRETLAHFLLPRRLRLLHPVRARERRPSGATASPLTGVRVHRKVSAPPSSGITVVPRSGAQRAARRRLARPLSARGPKPRGIGSRCRHPGCIDGGRRKR
jgi:hypothetical protein